MIDVTVRPLYLGVSPSGIYSVEMCVEPRASLDALQARKPAALPAIQPRFSGFPPRSLVTMQTWLSRLPFLTSEHKRICLL